MKKIICVFICVVLLCGCSSSISEVEEINKAEEPKSMFVMIEQAFSWEVVYHKDTKVMYAISDGNYSRGTFSLLVNADGTPMLYKGDAE